MFNESLEIWLIYSMQKIESVCWTACKNAKAHNVYHCCLCFIFDQTIQWPKNKSLKLNIEKVRSPERFLLEEKKNSFYRYLYLRWRQCKGLTLKRNKCLIFIVFLNISWLFRIMCVYFINCLRKPLPRNTIFLGGIFIIIVS